MATRFILRLRLSTEHHYAFKPSPCLKRVELPLNEQIFNTIGIIIDHKQNAPYQGAFFILIAGRTLD
ncbi:hypothetical protein [Shewanella baltica]|uniref:hypothetical protein n=1 Tax=Shewanella baltica TaxID=62322 RepID=UPI00217DE42F|nr:hypothetical protein [Shewanella baltica]MCS6124027.1 hypothetical protein [Shewanella baltica]